MPIESLDRSQLRSRHVLTGKLILDTALHIGGGRDTSSVSDSPIIRDGTGRPFIPGSSFKGAFRATVERLLPNVPHYRSCQLNDGFADCLSTTHSDMRKAFGSISEIVGRGIQLGAGNEDLKVLKRPDWVNTDLTEKDLLELLDEYLCDTCKTFGSVYLASAVRFSDLPVTGVWSETTQIRDGVGIDRDSERAIPQIKFDYEVVPTQTAFDLRLVLESPTERDLALIALGLLEFVNGMVLLGGIRSRGLGRCHLEELQVSTVNFQDPKSLREYLLKGMPEPRPVNGSLQEWLKPLFSA